MWSAWETTQTIPATIDGSSGTWHQGYAFLSDYVGKWIRIAFFQIANHDGNMGYGWYIDDIEFPMISPVINDISFTRYIPSPCTSLITVTTSNPCGGNLVYNWDTPDGGDIIGTGSEVEFVPPGTRLEPYQVRGSVTSELTYISSALKTIKIYTEVAYDHDVDGDIDGSDLAEFAAIFNEDNDLARFAEEFGMIACQ